MHRFTAIFLFFLATSLITQLWLARRQLRHVRAHRDAVPDAFADRVSHADHRRAADYTAAKTQFGMIEAGYLTAWLLLWTLGGGLDLLDTFWRQQGWPETYTGLVVVASLFVIVVLYELPFRLYQTFRLENKFGFNRTMPATFVGDLLKQLVVAAVLGLPILFVILQIMQTAGPLWWVWVWVVWTLFTLFIMWVYPAVIAPLFNRFAPLEKEDLRRRIQDLLQRSGFQLAGIFVMDASRRSSHGNAYFTGLGKNKRIVFFDTLMKSLTDDEIEAVLAHELGHFRLRHVMKRIALLLVATFAGLGILGIVSATDWFYHGLGLTHASTYGALLLFMMAGPVFVFFVQPLVSLASRKHEFEADAYAARHVDARALITALVKLYRDNASTLTPDPLHSIFYDSHPPAPVRIARLANPAPA